MEIVNSEALKDKEFFKHQKGNCRAKGIRGLRMANAEEVRMEEDKILGRKDESSNLFKKPNPKRLGPRLKLGL